MTKRFAIFAVAGMMLVATCAFAGRGGGGGGSTSGKSTMNSMDKSSQKDLSKNSSKSDKGKGSNKVDAELDELNKQLTLTDEQKAKIKPILADKYQKIGALKKDSSVAKDDRKAKTKEIADATTQQIRPLLTPDQQTKLDQMPKGKSGKGGKHKNKGEEAK
jgi:Spy/CpxP family protein refolding chaperone